MRRTVAPWQRRRAIDSYGANQQAADQDRALVQAVGSGAHDAAAVREHALAQHLADPLDEVAAKRFQLAEAELAGWHRTARKIKATRSPVRSGWRWSWAAFRRSKAADWALLCVVLALLAGALGVVINLMDGGLR